MFSYPLGIVFAFECTMSCFVQGCLILPEGDEIVPPHNTAPRIELNKVTPDPTLGPVNLSGCKTQRFTALVSDLDAKDTLYWRVFVDYYRDPDPSSSVIGRIDIKETKKFIQFVIDTKDTRFGGVSRFNEPHSVELLLADREFEVQNITPPFGRQLVDENGYVDSFTWVVRLTDEICPDPNTAGDES